MITPREAIEHIKKNTDSCDRAAWLTAFIGGLLIHMPALIFDMPNHDGLASVYSDQDLLTSGRWFLSFACGISSYYSIPWLIGVISFVYIAFTAVLTARILSVKEPLFAGFIGAILASFPVLASNFAYAFTMDGYMLGLMLAVLAVYVTDKGKWGPAWGALFLAFSVGVYQAYLSVAMILSLYCAVVIFTDRDREHKVKGILRYIVMGIQGMILYYVILRVKLIIAHKELADYQGIGFEGTGRPGLVGTLVTVYKDFVSFTTKSKIMAGNRIALVALAAFGLTALILLVKGLIEKKRLADFRIWIAAAVSVVALPVCADMILLANPNVTYHTLMRYQWAFIIAIAVSVIGRRAFADKKALTVNLSWAGVLSLLVMVFSFAITDNIAYSNLNKKYEKTYAYTLRLLDRIETTPGYTKDMPINLIGVVGSEAFPLTDVTAEVTDGMLGISGDYLIYRPENYKLFMEYYLGATLNIQAADASGFYYEDWYVDMHPFPAEDSIVIRDGVMYIKTENHERK